MAPADRAARNWPTARALSSGTCASAASASRACAKGLLTDTGRPRSGSDKPRRASADSAKLPAFTAKAGPKPTSTASSAATGATAICAVTAAVQMPLFAVTTSSSSTSEGSSDCAAGAKKTCPADRPNATA